MHGVQRKIASKRVVLEHTVTSASKVPTPAAGSSDSLAAKLSLSKSLQAALVTTAGLSADQFQKIWADACSESGN
jgi:hypothetical protein